MGRTERRWFVGMSIGFLLAVSAATGAAASLGPDAAIESSSSRSASPAAFAERITTRDSRAVAVRGAALLAQCDRADRPGGRLRARRGLLLGRVGPAHRFAVSSGARPPPLAGAGGGRAPASRASPSRYFRTASRISPNSTHRSPSNLASCSCSIGAWSVGLVLTLMPGSSSGNSTFLRFCGLLHDVLAAEVVAALLEDLRHRLSGRVTERVGLVVERAVRIVLLHPRDPVL